MRWIGVVAVAGLAVLAQTQTTPEAPLIKPQPGQELTEGQKVINEMIEHHNQRVREDRFHMRNRPMVGHKP